MNNQFILFSLILITVLLNTIAQSLLKLGSGQNPLNIYLIGGILTYGLSTVFYIAVLSKFNLSFAYPVVIGLTILATTFVGALLFQEKISMNHGIGIGLILTGIWTILLKK
ncbi:small multidrug resistance protein [Sphaerospermopsis aphanizomenoides BCCUSP55]|uniref:DMT family transporter n=1 Tax=Sphaerospermopsis aphanizomenoides TaxID=459663 RepID=UPI001905CC1B|nr:SMR family transporter [Sphaerospermopsis aphanizomenoides]MBK1986960.1 small multidrug resistance protein [Sphaerospermopsis aphanizomenoides BCCUSP55]